ncbi:hypothetical protein [Fluviispira sanaruensis]|uniref:Uncharacterized protein n=1 Tax=Fluviispira sanaruensis TaxID=2493639 RepID=A0A4P2VH54_FLUSA|nr:hypothetical protein [Fluviispira sanaruensis]BBH52273.1 hypothetical protein JCM31447_07140 [Fluviispira sanaruensis]
MFIIGRNNDNIFKKEYFLSQDIASEDFLEKIKIAYKNVRHFDLIIHCASPYGESEVPNTKEMDDFYRVNVLAFWNLITYFIEDKKLIAHCLVVSIGSTAALKKVDHFNPASILAKNSFMQCFDIFQDSFLALGIKFCHIVLGSLGQDLILHSDIMKCIYFLSSMSSGCFPSRIIIKSKAEFS